MSVAGEEKMASWKEINHKLQVVLSKEIDLRREILGNMNQQEQMLLSGEIKLIEGLLRELSRLASSLKGVIKERGTLTRELFDHLPSNALGATLEEVLDPLIDVEEETLRQYQQAKELVEKIHGQHLRNKSLSDLIQKDGPIEMNNSAVKAETVKRKGTSLITIDYPEKKEAS